MTFWLEVIAIILVLILVVLKQGNSIKAAQVEAERDRHEMERLKAEEQREYDMFFGIKGYPHRCDDVRVAAWAAKRGWTLDEAMEFLLDAEVNDGISKALDEAHKKRISDIQKHGWHVSYAALAFTPEQRSGQDWRPLHGMIWKDSGEKYFLNLTDMSAFGEGGCSLSFPLDERSVPHGTFTIEKEQRYDRDSTNNKLCLVDIEPLQD